MGTFILTGILSTLAMFGAPDGAEGTKGDRSKRGHGMCERLECTDAQKAQLKKLREANKGDHKEHYEKVKALRAQLKAEFAKPTLDKAKITDLHDQITALRAEAGKKRFTIMLESAAILTPEQRAKMAQRMGKRRGFKSFRGKGKGRGEGKAKSSKSEQGRRGGRFKSKPAGKDGRKGKRGERGQGRSFAAR